MPVGWSAVGCGRTLVSTEEKGQLPAPDGRRRVRGMLREPRPRASSIRREALNSLA